MFESLRKKLKIFKESVSTEESELNSATIEASEDKTKPSDEAPEEASYETTTQKVVDVEAIGHASEYVEQVPQRIEPSNGSAVSYTHLRAHETDSYLVCRLLLEKKKKT